MRFGSAIAVLILLTGLGSALGTHADEIVVPLPPQICNLSVSRDPNSDDVIVRWSGGTPPFSVVRSDGPCFGKANEIKYLSDKISGHRYIDRHAQRAKRRFWYQVYDDNSGTQVFSIGPAEPERGDPTVIHPNGFGDCGDSQCGDRPRNPTSWK
jgi:hypothetical protein